jgi:hypothetical protein
MRSGKMKELMEQLIQSRCVWPSFSADRSPNGGVSQVRLRAQDVKWMPSTFRRLGIIWIALLPLPMTPTCLFWKSYLFLSRSVESFESASCSDYFSFHAAECIISPANDFKPGISGHAMSFNKPRASMRIFALSTKTSLVILFSTVTDLS